MPEPSPDATSSRAGRLDAMREMRVGVVGDFAADHTLTGITSRISREAPVLILKKKEDTVRPGQAGNSAANLAALGVRCEAFGVVGDDRHGAILRDELERLGVETAGLQVSPGGRTIAKTRILAGSHHTSLQQVIRLDDDEALVISDEAAGRLRAALLERLPALDALLVSDYGYGVVTRALWEAMLGAAGEGRRRPMVLDSRHRLAELRGAGVITPNETEVYEQLGIRDFERADPAQAGRRLIEMTGCGGLIMTRGNEGMLVFEGDGEPRAIPIFGSDEVTDVTGAGDTVAAVTTAALATGASLFEAASLANVAAGLAVMKRGAATVSPEEMRRALGAEGAAE